MTGRTCIGALLVVGLLGLPNPGQCQGNIKLGRFRILPSLETSGEYNDNVNLAPRNEQSDFIWTISPGIAVELPSERYPLRLGYQADILRYVERDELDTIYHTARGDARANFPGGLSLYVSDEFRKTTDFAGFPVPELTRRVDRDENVLEAGAEYTIRQRYSVALDYRFLLVNYRDEPEFDELDRDEHQVGLTLFYRIFPKTSVLAEYDYQIIRYDMDFVADDRDSESHKVKVGARGDLTAKTSVVVKVGGEWKDYENPAREDWSGVIVEASVIYRYREPSQLRLFGGRANVESTFQNNNFYITTYGGVEVTHRVRKLVFRIRGLVGVNDYPEAFTVGNVTRERSDDFYAFRAGVLYQIRPWLAVEVGYGFRNRDSNLADLDYTNNRVFGTVTLTF